MDTTNPPKHPDDRLIDAMGGTTAVAKECGVTPQAISQWRTKGIPDGWRRYFTVSRPQLFRSHDKAA